MRPVLYPLTKLPPWFGGQMGVPGSSNPEGLRMAPTGVVMYVDKDHSAANDSNPGTDPRAPKLTIDSAVQSTLLTTGSVIAVAPGTYSESVVTPDYDTGPNYVTLVGQGVSEYSPAWESGAAASPCLDLRAVGWRVIGFRFQAPTTEACIQLRHTDTNANDIAIRTKIQACLFDGLTTGLYGIATHGCYDVWVEDCVFQLFHNVGGTATAFYLESSPLAIPYRQHLINCLFWDNDNHVICPQNGSEVFGCRFIKAGYAYTATQVLQTSLGGNPGDDNTVALNILTGDYSVAGGYTAGAADNWFRNFNDDVAEPEVSAECVTIARPA